MNVELSSGGNCGGADDGASSGAMSARGAPPGAPLALGAGAGGSRGDRLIGWCDDAGASGNGGDCWGKGNDDRERATGNIETTAGERGRRPGPLRSYV